MTQHSAQIYRCRVDVVQQFLQILAHIRYILIAMLSFRVQQLNQYENNVVRKHAVFDEWRHIENILPRVIQMQLMSSNVIGHVSCRCMTQQHLVHDGAESVYIATL